MGKVFNIIAIVAAIIAAIVGLYVVCKKLLAKKEEASDEENYVSCSCEQDFIAETVSEEAKAEAPAEGAAE